MMMELNCQNIHIARPQWLQALSQAITDFRPHDTFRLFFTSNSSDRVPETLLQQCVKLTTEPPAGLAANIMRQLVVFKDENLFSTGAKEGDFKVNVPQQA
jgi:dynein heavy chain, axonemal